MPFAGEVKNTLSFSNQSIPSWRAPAAIVEKLFDLHGYILEAQRQHGTISPILRKELLGHLLISMQFWYHVDATTQVGTVFRYLSKKKELFLGACMWKILWVFNLVKLSDLLWILVESKLFFKQPTSWRPRISRDLMISVASEMTKQTLGSFEGGAQLPVQVWTWYENTCIFPVKMKVFS